MFSSVFPYALQYVLEIKPVVVLKQSGKKEENTQDKKILKNHHITLHPEGFEP